MTRGSRCLFTVLLAAVLGLAGVARAAAGPAVDSAPGRVVVQVDDGSVRPDVDAGGALHAVALPDGSALLFGSGAADGVLYATKIGSRGALDRSFGTAGVATLRAPGNAISGLRQVLRQPDGKLLFVSAWQSTLPQFAPNDLLVTRTNADLSLDRSYGLDGTRFTGIGEGCGSCTPAALAPDGSLVLTGTTGDVPSPSARSNLRWALTRLTPQGAVDASFGASGIATIATDGPARGFNVAIGPGGTIVTEAQAANIMESRLLLTRLTPNGTPDPAFAGGTLIVTPLSDGFGMLVQDDGAIVLNGSLPLAPGPPTRREALIRYTPAGAPDAAFGAGGFVNLGRTASPLQLLPAAGGSVLVAETATAELTVQAVLADGAIAGRRYLRLRFGGGTSSFLVSVRPRPVATVRQNSFRGRQLLRRTDGSYLLYGGVAIVRPTAEGAGFSIGRFAVAALTPSLTADDAFGGPPTPLRLSVRLPRQRASTARRRHGIRVSLQASKVGLVRVKITHRGRALALSLLPNFKTTRHTLPVELTRHGNAYLRRHRNLRVSITATARDLLTNNASATARGHLP